jgi:hypothetical protein
VPFCGRDIGYVEVLGVLQPNVCAKGFIELFIGLLPGRELREHIWVCVWRHADLGSSNEKTISRCLACVNTVMPGSRRIPRIWAKLKDAHAEIQRQFIAHKCRPLDESHDAPLTVRNTTGDK